MWLALLATLLAQPEAGGSCPSDAAVRAELAKLSAEHLQPEVTVAGNHMHVVLRDRAGLVLGKRDVEPATDCQERATQVAVLTATWMGIWAAESTLPPPVSPPPVSPPPLTQSRHEISLIGLAAHDGNAGALGGQVMAQTALSSGAWRGLVAFSALTQRQATVEPGSAGYFRMAADVGPALRWQGRGAFVEGALAARLALLRLQGKGLAVTHSAFHVAPGVNSFVRAGLQGRTVSAFLFVGGVAWLNRYELLLDNARTRAELPRWDAMLGLGMGWAFGG
jgi:hypothetical protein